MQNKINVSSSPSITFKKLSPGVKALLKDADVKRSLKMFCFNDTDVALLDKSELNISLISEHLKDNAITPESGLVLSFYKKYHLPKMVIAFPKSEITNPNGFGPSSFACFINEAKKVVTLFNGLKKELNQQVFRVNDNFKGMSLDSKSRQALKKITEGYSGDEDCVAIEELDYVQSATRVNDNAKAKRRSDRHNFAEVWMKKEFESRLPNVSNVCKIA